MRPGKSLNTAAAFDEDQLTREVSQSDIEKHMADTDIHTSKEEKKALQDLSQDFSSHARDIDIHVTPEQVESWNSKETPTNAKLRVDKIANKLLMHQNDDTAHLTKIEKEKLNDKYSRSEINALLSYLVSNINWLKEVETFKDLATTYPNPKVGDTCAVRSESVSYTFNGVDWVVSLFSIIPTATEYKPGLLSKEDKSKLDNIEINANNYTHPDNIYTRHVSDAQIDTWDNKADANLVSSVLAGLMSPADKLKLDSIRFGANKYMHPTSHRFDMIETDMDHQFISQEEKDEYSSKVNKDDLISAVNDNFEESKRYTNNAIAKLSTSSPELYELLLKIKDLITPDIATTLLKEISQKVNEDEFNSHKSDQTKHLTKELLDKINTLVEDSQCDWNDTNVDSPNYIKNKPVSLPANGGNADKVGGYDASTLFSNRRSSTIVIGTDTAHNCLARSLDFICNGTDDDEVVQKAFDSIGDGGTILFREGTYTFNSSIVLKANHVTIESCNSTFVKNTADNILFNIIGDYNIIRDCNFEYKEYPKDGNMFIVLMGSNNRITSNRFKNGCALFITEGSYNKVDNNVIIDPYFGIQIAPKRANCTFNFVTDNIISGGYYGIILKSSGWSILHSIINNNTILNSNAVGILLDSKTQTNDKTSGCTIKNNHIVRAFGDDSSYGTNQKDIMINYGYRNIISGNSLKKYEIKGSYNTFVNNTVL